MGKDELMYEKIQVDEEIARLDLYLQSARMRAKRDGRFLPIEKYQKETNRLISLRRKSQELQLLIGKERKKGYTLPQTFMKVAEQHLSRAEFQKLLEIAKTEQDEIEVEP